MLERAHSGRSSIAFAKYILSINFAWLDKCYPAIYTKISDWKESADRKLTAVDFRTEGKEYIPRQKARN